MGLEFEYIKGQSPLDEDEREGLIIKTISTRGELDEFEQKNIESAVAWTLNKNYKIAEILTEKFVLALHKQMFGEVWKWAGKYRKSNKNIGVDKFQIQTELRKLIEDCRFWIDHKVFKPDEIAIRFKHRLVQIHLFPNGNGRHSRLCADILISKGLKKPIFTWGSKNLSKKSESRKKYLEAIYAADGGDHELLIEFARS